MVRALVICVFLVALGGATTAQDFNVDVGSRGSAPSSGYGGAAGQPGLWNSVTADHVTPFTTGPSPDDMFLVNVHGNPTGVGFHQFGGMDLVSASDPSVSGDDAALLNDYLATHSTSLENCMYLNGLENGTYEVITYAWMPDSPGTQQQVRFDFVPGTKIVGGSWTGTHAEGVTYSRDVIEVTGGQIGWHVGIPSGGATFPGAAFNGFQLTRIDAASVPLQPRGVLAALVGLAAALGAWVLRRR